MDSPDLRLLELIEGQMDLRYDQSNCIGIHKSQFEKSGFDEYDTPKILNKWKMFDVIKSWKYFEKDEDKEMTLTLEYFKKYGYDQKKNKEYCFKNFPENQRSNLYILEIDFVGLTEISKEMSASKNKGVYYNTETGIGWANGKRFIFKAQKQNYLLFKKLYENINKPISKEEIWDVCGHKDNKLFINEVAKELREKTGFSKNELVLSNNSLILSSNRLDNPPAAPQEWTID